LLFSIYRLMWTKTVKPEWIVDSVGAGVKLDHRRYMLFNINEYGRNY
jgi:hypothetical protein